MKLEQEVWSYKGRTRDLIRALKRAGYAIENRPFSIRQRGSTRMNVITDAKYSSDEIAGYIDNYRGLFRTSQPAVLVAIGERLREFVRSYPNQ